MEIKCFDWRGNEFKVGGTVIYAVTHRSSVKMMEAVIQEIIIKEYPINNNEQPRFRLKVMPTASHHKSEMKWRGSQWVWDAVKQEGEHIEVDVKPVTLTAVDRVTVIPDGTDT